MFNEFLNQILDGIKQVEGVNLFPRVMSNKQEDGTLQLDFVIPGFDKNNIDASYDDDVITVECVKPDEKNQYEFAFCKKYRIGTKFDVKKIKAEYKEGILRVSLPAKSGGGGKKVTIV